MAIIPTARTDLKNTANVNPDTIRIMFQILRNFDLLILIEKMIWARAGIIISPVIIADSMANVLVNARGLNNFPSAACIAKTGRKLTIVVARAVINAGATSIVAL